MSRPRRRLNQTTFVSVACGVLVGLLSAQLVTSVSGALIWAVQAIGFTLVLTAAIEPLVRLLLRVGLQRRLASLIAVLGVVGGVVVVVSALTPPVVRVITYLFSDPEATLQRMTAALSSMFPNFHLELPDISQIQASVVRLDAPSFVSNVSPSSTLVATTQTALVVFLTYHLSAAYPRLRSTIQQLHTSSVYRRFLEAWDTAMSQTAAFVAANGKLALIAGSFAALVAWITGVPSAWAVGLWAALGSMVPVAGGLLASIFPVAAALAHDLAGGSGLTATLVAAAAHLVFQAADNYWLRPRIIGNSLDLHPAVTLVVLLFGAALAGPLGFVVAVPLAATVQTMGREWLHSRLESVANIPPTTTVDSDVAS